MSNHRILVTTLVTMLLIVVGPSTLWGGTVTSDLSVTKTDGAASSIPGMAIVYTIVATNIGPGDATGAAAVTVTDNFPAALIGCAWTCIPSAGSSCTAAGAGNIADSADLISGGTATYTASCNIDPAATGTLVNTVTVSSTNADPNMADNTATDSNTLTPTSDLAISKTDGAASSVPGTTVTYTIVATNNGPSDSAGTVTDNFPAALSNCNWTCSASAGSTCTAAGAGNIADAVTLLSGGTATYTATCDIDPAATGTLDNTATVTSANTDPNNANNSATDSNTLDPSSDLSVSIMLDPPSPQAGDPFTFIITVDNAGPSDATNVTVDLSIPPAFTVTGTTGCVEDPNGFPTCTLGTIAAGGSAVYEVEAVTPNSGAEGSATATVDSDSSDPVTSDNEDEVPIAIGGLPVIEIPTADTFGLSLLILLLTAAGIWRIRRS